MATHPSAQADTSRTQNLERPRAEGQRVERVEREPARRTLVPAVDILEGAQETWLVADLPGVTRDGLELELQHNELRLRGRAEARFDDEAFDYVRSFRLPTGIDGDKVTADLRDGVLTLKLPKPPELKPRRIDVRVA